MAFEIKFTRLGFENFLVLKALPGKLDIKRHSPCILYIADCIFRTKLEMCQYDTDVPAMGHCMRYETYGRR